MKDPVQCAAIWSDSFCGDVVLDAFIKVSREEDSILDKIYQSKYVRNIITKILFLYNIKRKYILTH